MKDTHIEDDFELNEAEIEHLKVISAVNEMIEKDENLIKKVFPGGYEDIKLPINKIAFGCPCCSARTSFIYRTCKNKEDDNTLLICQCLRCNADYAIFRKGNQINVVLLNYDNL